MKQNQFFPEKMDLDANYFCYNPYKKNTGHIKSTGQATLTENISLIHGLSFLKHCVF